MDSLGKRCLQFIIIKKSVSVFPLSICSGRAVAILTAPGSLCLLRLELLVRRALYSQWSFSLLSPPALIQIPPLLGRWVQFTSVTFPAPCLAKRRVALPITEGDLHKIQMQLYYHSFFCLKFFNVLCDLECYKSCSAVNGPGVCPTE